MNTTEYKITAAITSEALERQVNAFMKQGWRLAGGVATNGDAFYQAMTRTVNEHGDVQ